MIDIAFFNENNLCVIPVMPRDKSPKGKWKDRTKSDNNPHDFSPRDNFGVVLGEVSDGLVDIDLDCSAAIEFAPYFLPPTGWIFGRASKPSSHYLYRVSGEVGRRHVFHSGSDVICEYRSSGNMTVFPPSIHKTGEIIQWVAKETVGVTTQDHLLRCLHLVAIATIINPFYKISSRNSIVLHLSGTLLSDGYSEDEVSSLISALGAVNSDEEIPTRLLAIKATAERLKKAEPV